MSEPRVLVATPIRADAPLTFFQCAQRNYESLTWPDKAWALYPNLYTRPPSARYAGNAQARNELLDLFLDPFVSHILWLDADLVRVPPDLIERLMAISDRDVVAPFVFVERIQDGPIGIPNGGWFYDTGAFIHRGQCASMLPPHWSCQVSADGVMEMDSVGTCYLIPAWLYREPHRLRYAAQGDEVEHVGLMRQVRALGVRVLATDRVICEHAYLPRYGVGWNG